MKKALVLGATGLIGKHLTAELAADNGIDEVVAMTRRPVQYGNDKIKNLVVDFNALAQSADAIKGDILFSCLGTTLKQAGSVEAQRKVDLDYQLDVARIASDNGVAHYLLVSSSGANAESRSAYFAMKGQLEAKVLALPFSRISIFRPSLLLGQRDKFRVAESLASYIAPAICKLPGLQRYRPITGADVARKMLQVSNSHGDARETYTLEEVHL